MIHKINYLEKNSKVFWMDKWRLSEKNEKIGKILNFNDNNNNLWNKKYVI